MATNRLALGYLRTSSAANVGDEKDSRNRQILAIQAYGRRSGFKVLGFYYDAVVSGADVIEERTAFPKMLAFIADHPEIRTIMVETPDRFARDLIVQETGYRMLKERGITLIPVSSPDHFAEETPTAILVRQILGAISQFEKSMLVSKLRGARVRKKAAGVKVEGRKSHAELHPQVVALARKLHRKPRNGDRLPLRAIADKLATAGHLNSKGKPYSASAVLSMLSG